MGKRFSAYLGRRDITGAPRPDRIIGSLRWGLEGCAPQGELPPSPLLLKIGEYRQVSPQDVVDLNAASQC